MGLKVPLIRVPPPGPKARAIIALDERYIATSTKTAPVVVKRAEGAVVEELDGTLPIAFSSGVSVLNVGHGHPKVLEAIRRQAAHFTHFAGTDYYYEGQARLAERLAKKAPGRRPRKVFFTNSGTESTEAAIKIARHHTRRGLFLAFLKAFHGRTMGSLALTASKAVHRRGYVPLMPSPVPLPPAPSPARTSSRTFTSRRSRRRRTSRESSWSPCRARAVTSSPRRDGWSASRGWLGSTTSSSSTTRSR